MEVCACLSPPGSAWAWGASKPGRRSQVRAAWDVLSAPHDQIAAPQPQRGSQQAQARGGFSWTASSDAVPTPPVPSSRCSSHCQPPAYRARAQRIQGRPSAPTGEASDRWAQPPPLLAGLTSQHLFQQAWTDIWDGRVHRPQQVFQPQWVPSGGAPLPPTSHPHEDRAWGEWRTPSLTAQ